MTRLELSEKYLIGSGVELAPFHNPWPLISQIRCHYLDRYSNEELRFQYPECAHLPLQSLDSIEDGQYLTRFKDLDFVIASHFLEHCENAIASLESWLRALKPGGCILLALPEKNNFIDKNRETTTWQHFLLDREVLDKRSHYREYLSVVNRLTGSTLEQQIEENIKLNAHIHFHTWTWESWIEFLDKTQSLLSPLFNIEHNSLEGLEFLTVLRRR